MEDMFAEGIVSNKLERFRLAREHLMEELMELLGASVPSDAIKKEIETIISEMKEMTGVRDA